MEIEESQSDGVLILRPQGRLDTVSAPSLQATALAHLDAGTRSLVLDLENVVLIPHLGSATVETRSAMARLAARNAVEVLDGRSAVNPVS